MNEIRGCMFSPCRRYRYSLWRDADGFGQGFCMFIGLNPSTADEFKNDPTIRRCIRFAKEWGYARLLMTNLFGFRATDPGDMRLEADPVGPDNDGVLLVSASKANLIVAAWGAEGAYRQRGQWAIASLPPMMCLGLTKDGHPRHPLYCRAGLQPVPFRREATT